MRNIFHLILGLFLFQPLLSVSQVVIYSGCQYTGISSTLAPGNYYNAFQFRLNDNSLSSIRVPPGFRVELFDDFNLTGIPTVLSSSVSCLNAGMNNRTSSIRVIYNSDNPWNQANPEGGVSIFTGCQYTGRNAFLPPGDYPRLHTVIGNNAISSFRIPEGMVLELFTNENMSGTSSGKLSSDNQCLGTYWNNTASSARVYYGESGGWIPPNPPSAPNGEIRLYSSCSFRGFVASLSDGDFNNFRTIMNNRPLGSLQIPPGMTIELYSGYNQSGSILARYSSNRTCIEPAIYGRTLSARVFSGSPGGNWNQKGVALYTDCDFRGRSKTLATGRYSNLNSSTVQINPASLRVGAGYEIVLYEQPNFTGNSSGRITEDNNCLGTYWRGKARSAIVSINSGSGSNFEEVMFYADCYYRGRSQSLRPGYYDNMGYGISSTLINPASLHVPPGYRVELFQQPGYSGTKTVLTADNTCLGTAFRGKVRSMIITFNGYGGDTWNPSDNQVSFFSACYFSGNSKTLPEGQYPDLTQIGMGYTTNNIASLKVPFGYEVDLFVYPRYQGSRTVIRGDNSCLGTAFKGRIRSMAIRRIAGTMPYENTKEQNKNE